MRTKWAVISRVLGVVILLVVGLGSSWGRIHPVLAEVSAQDSLQTGQVEPVPFEATLGEPAEINLAPKDGAAIPETQPAGPPSPAPELPDRTLANQPDDYWTSIIEETFEGTWPSTGWQAFDNNGSTGGDVYWDDTSYRYQTGYWSGWAANGGVNGVEPGPAVAYPASMDSWMVYGPFDLSNCGDADVWFYYWNYSESGYDYFGWAASRNGSNFYGSQLSGDQRAWNFVDFDLKPYLGDSSVWLMFRFISDSSVQLADGAAYVDNITLWCYTDDTPVSWTYMVYLDGDNNLEAAAIDDFLEMSSVGSSANVDIVVQFDRIGGYSTAYDDWTDTKRYHITAGMTPTAANAIAGIGETNMGYSETLLEFIRWGRAAYPANNYAVVLWDHGNGWTLRDPEDAVTKGIIYDDTSGDNIDMPELRSVLSSFTGSGANPIELFGLDACLMAMIEVDNQIKPYADVRVTSQETEPADGWPHNTILAGLVGNPSWTASQLATRIVDDYYTSYGNNNTQSAVNLGAIYTSLNTATNSFAQALIAWAPYYRTEITNARNVSQTFSNTTYIDLWDFSDWVRIYASAIPELVTAATNAENATLATVIREWSGPSWPYARGISIYFPKTAAEYDARYDGSSGFLQFTGSTQWDEWVRMYHVLGNYPGNFNKSSPANGATGQLLSLTLSWGASTGATSYAYCYDTTNDNACTSWVSTGGSTSAVIGSLSPSTTYYWQVRATNATGTLYANMAPTAYWSFTTGSPPAAFNKTSPANGALDQLLSVTLSWGAASGATSYSYCIDTTNDGTCTPWLTNGMDTSVTLVGLSPSTTYYWHAAAYNSFGTTYSNGSATAFWSFTTGPLPGAFSKVSPGNAATGQPLSLTLSWGTSANATSYEYCYDTSNDNACSGWTSTGGAASASIGGLSTGMTYYWHARALNAIGTTYANGAATAFWSFTTGTPPATFGKSSPANAATSVSLTPTLSWEAASGAVSYDYCYDTSDDGACSGWTSAAGATSAPISGLSSATIYYWQVRALNSFGTTYANGSATAYWSFTTGSPPTAFGKSSPGNGVTGQPVSLTLTWGAASGVTSYEYCYDDSNDNACASWTSTGTGTSALLNGLTYGATYYWQVRALNSFGTTYADGASTAFWAFTTGNLPGAFSKVSPGNGASDQPTSLTLTWNAASGASSYEYCYDASDDDACTTWVGTGTTSVLLDSLMTGTTYYWQVRALNSFGMTYAEGSSMAYWSFTTGLPPGSFNKTSPSNGAINQPLSPTLSWGSSLGASSYQYCYDTLDNNACDGVWTSSGTNTTAMLNGLFDNTVYYWQVRALNSFGTMVADSEAWWHFTTVDVITYSIFMPLVKK